MTREEAIKEINKHFPSTSCGEHKELIKALGMAIEALSAERTGEWTNTGVLTVHCSNCKSEFQELQAMNYCPNCGADMRGEKNE